MTPNNTKIPSVVVINGKEREIMRRGQEEAAQISNVNLKGALGLGGTAVTHLTRPPDPSLRGDKGERSGDPQFVQQSEGGGEAREEGEASIEG